MLCVFCFRCVCVSQLRAWRHNFAILLHCVLERCVCFYSTHSIAYDTELKGLQWKGSQNQTAHVPTRIILRIRPGPQRLFGWIKRRTKYVVMGVGGELKLQRGEFGVTPKMSIGQMNEKSHEDEIWWAVGQRPVAANTWKDHIGIDLTITDFRAEGRTNINVGRLAGNPNPPEKPEWDRPKFPTWLTRLPRTERLHG